MNTARVTLDRWQSLFRDLRCGAADPTEFERLVAAYRERHRRYHTLEHLEACLAEFDGVRALAQRPAEVELALWFHDAVCVAGRTDNEAKSADWARRVLRAAVVPDAVGARVAGCILATRHDPVPAEGDAALVVDIDHAVLGRSGEPFEAFERDVRAEYRWTSGFVYRRRRRRALKALLERPAIYTVPTFRERFETPARCCVRPGTGAGNRASSCSPRSTTRRTASLRSTRTRTTTS
jgi:predicted metal-dependent HD superfamily phosphohydrolase